MDEEKIGYKSYEPEHLPSVETDGETPDTQDDTDAAEAAVEILEEPATLEVEVEAEEVPIPQQEQEQPTVEVLTPDELQTIISPEIEGAVEQEVEPYETFFDPTPIVDAINKNASTSTSHTVDVGDDKLTIINEVTTGDLMLGALIAANVIVVLLTRLIGR